MKTEDTLLFLKYAVPAIDFCTPEIAKIQIESYVKQISDGKIPEGDIDKKFKVAQFWILKIAQEHGRKEPNSEDIREYFWSKHNSVVDEIADKNDPKRDFCKIYAGRIIEINGNEATVDTCVGEKKYRLDFIKNARVDAFLIGHRHFGVELTDEKTAMKLNAPTNSKSKSKCV